MSLIRDFNSTLSSYENFPTTEVHLKSLIASELKGLRNFSKNKNFIRRVHEGTTS